MHLGAQLLELLLVGDAEMLLLVDDDEAEVPEFDSLAEQRVGADDDIDLALGEALLGLRQLGGADEARRLGDVDRIAIAETKAARSATSVLPKPTSPQISRSIGRPELRSASTAAIAACWSSVSS